MGQQYIANVPSWVICHNANPYLFNYNVLEVGQRIETGLDTLEVYYTEAEADARYRDFDPMWKIGPFDVNAASAADFDQLPGVGPVIAAEIVAGQPHWVSVEALTNIGGITAEMVAEWDVAVFWDAVTYEPPEPD
jgi:hypothetical protein